MKILFLADGKPSESLKTLSQGCGIIVLLGDMMEEWIGEVKEIDIPKVGIHGNHDKFDFSNFGIIDAHLKKVVINNISFMGFKGDMEYVFAENNRPYKDKDLVKYKNELKKLEEQPKCDIFISHSPPLGVHDWENILGHKGLKSFRKYIEKNNPKYHFHGHMHRPDNTKINSTEIFCVYPYMIIDI